jgi:hypothetical protein
VFSGSSPASVGAPLVYERHRRDATTLYAVVRDNLETLYGAVDEGAIPVTLPAFVRKELEGYLDCGLLCRGFSRLKCEGCGESRLVAFACKGPWILPVVPGQEDGVDGGESGAMRAAARASSTVGAHGAVRVEEATRLRR